MFNNRQSNDEINILVVSVCLPVFFFTTRGLCKVQAPDVIRDAMTPSPLSNPDPVPSHHIGTPPKHV